MFSVTSFPTEPCTWYKFGESHQMAKIVGAFCRIRRILFSMNVTVGEFTSQGKTDVGQFSIRVQPDVLIFGLFE